MIRIRIAFVLTFANVMKRQVETTKFMHTIR